MEGIPPPTREHLEHLTKHLEHVVKENMVSEDEMASRENVVHDLQISLRGQESLNGIVLRLC